MNKYEMTVVISAKLEEEGRTAIAGASAFTFCGTYDIPAATIETALKIATPFLNCFLIFYSFQKIKLY